MHKPKKYFISFFLLISYIIIYFLLINDNLIYAKELYNNMKTKKEQLEIIEKNYSDLTINREKLINIQEKNSDINKKIIHYYDLPKAILKLDTKILQNKLVKEKIELLEIEEINLDFEKAEKFYNYQIIIETYGELKSILNFINILQKESYEVNNFLITPYYNESKNYVELKICISIYTVKYDLTEEIILPIDSKKDFRNPFYYGGKSYEE